MAAQKSLTALKTAFLLPLEKIAKVIPESLPTLLPGTNANCVVSRHDHHNIEVKTVSELGDASSLVETDLYIFIPRNFEIRGWGKAELQKDFRTRMRLALPVKGEQGAAALESGLKNLRASLTKLEELEIAGAQMDMSHGLCEEVLESTKDLVAVISETLKHGATEHVREFFLSHTLMTVSNACIGGLKTLVSQIEAISLMISKVRSISTSEQKNTSAILSFFDEYVSQLYVQYLGTIRSELAKMGMPKTEGLDTSAYITERDHLESLLDSLQEQEARYRVRFGGRSLEEESDLDREQRLVRLSQLKKFFQSKSFIDISRQQSAKRVSEWTAAAGTGMAGLFAIMVERYFRPTENVTVSGMFLLTFGVIVYVLRDRMKDWLRNSFQENALKYLPDFEQQLVAKDRKIGRVKEWLQIIKPAEIPSDIVSLRRAVSANEMEKRLPEDVVHVRKIQEVHAAPLASAGHMPLSRALHENTRVNFERYLKHMDDPFKEFTDLDLNGRFTLARTHRVYHFYLCVKTVSRPLDPRLRAKIRNLNAPPPPTREQTRIYRIVLDKNGVVRLEPVVP